MQELTQKEIFQILKEARVIAVVGHSAKPDRESYRVAQYLRNAGYKIYAANPMVDEIDGEKSYPTVAAIPEQVDIVDIFRRSEHLDAIAKDAIEADAKVFWGQLGVVNETAGEKVAKAGLKVVMNRCMKIEHQRMMRG